jgi:glycosyltransferase involved in cell wall biosynthesis
MVKSGITIVTVVKNHKNGLLKTWKSLQIQDFCDWQMVIVLAESNDGTEEIARNIQKNNDRVALIYQSDAGIYPAMNLGLSQVVTSHVWFMNAGDCFFEESSLRIAFEKVRELGADIVIGGHQVQGFEDSRTYKFREKKLTKLIFGLNRRFGCHQSMIFLTDSLKSVGGYNTTFRICCDFEAVLKIIEFGVVYRISIILSSIEPGGGADQEIRFVLNERQLVREKHMNFFTSRILGKFWTYLAFLNLWVKTRNTNRVRKLS